MPLSSTSTTTRDPWRSAEMRTTAGTPGRAYFTAFPTRLAKSWRTATSSAWTSGSGSSGSTSTSSGRRRAVDWRRAPSATVEPDVRRHQVTGLGHRVGQQVVDEPGHLHRRLLGASDRGRRVALGVEVEGGHVEPGRIAVSGPRRSCAAVEAKPTSGRIPLRCSVTSLSTSSTPAPAWSPGWLSSRVRDTATTRSSPGATGSWTSPTPSSARTAPVCAMRRARAPAPPAVPALSRPGLPAAPGGPGGGWRRCCDRCVPCRSRTMRPSSMLSVISASSSACSAAVARARAIRPTSSSIRSPRVPTASPVSSTETRKSWATSVTCIGLPWRLREGPRSASVSRIPPTPRATAWRDATNVENRAADHTHSGITRKTIGSGCTNTNATTSTDTAYRVASSRRRPTAGPRGDLLRVPLPREVADTPDSDEAGELPAEPSLERPRAPDVHPGQPHADAAEGGAHDAAHRCGGAGPRHGSRGAEARGPSGAEEGRAPAAHQRHHDPGLQHHREGPEDDQGRGRARDRGDRGVDQPQGEQHTRCAPGPIREQPQHRDACPRPHEAGGLPLVDREARQHREDGVRNGEAQRQAATRLIHAMNASSSRGHAKPTSGNCPHPCRRPAGRTTDQRLIWMSAPLRRSFSSPWATLPTCSVLACSAIWSRTWAKGGISWPCWPAACCLASA